MLYVIYGTDTNKARIKMRELRDVLLKKKPGAAAVRLDDETFNAALLDEHISSQGLFSERSIVVLDRVFSKKEFKDEVLSRLSDISSSANVFLLLEGSLDKTTLGKLEKKAEKVQMFEEAKSKVAKAPRSFFPLADALGERNKKKLWVLYREAVKGGAVPEELHGILFWQVKSMLLAAGAKDAKAAGLNPFVFKKSRAYAALFPHRELVRLSGKLVSLYHDAHRGLTDFETGLELLILEI